MITSNVDMRELEAGLLKTAAAFGEANETGIARWGVSVCRRLIVTTQSWGDGKKAKDKQEGAMMRDIKRAFIVVEKPDIVKKIKKGKMSGIHWDGLLYTFRPHQQIVTADGVNLFVEANRKAPHKRVPLLPPGIRCITTDSAAKAAMVKRRKRVFKGKGGWVGAGQGIGRFQKMGSRITIGKNVAGPAHKWKSGGTAGMKRDTWNPEGSLTNNFKHVSDSYVLKPGDMQKAVIDGGKNTITWYEKALQGRLNRKR